MNRKIFAAAICVAGAAVPAFGQTITALGSFGENGTNTVGGVILSNGILYGSTDSGNTVPTEYGSVFSVSATGNGGLVNILGSFDFTNGQSPQAGVLLSGSTLYGTTALGGAGGTGGIFSEPIGGGTPTLVSSFNGGDGSYPRFSTSLILSGTTFYGTTEKGGDHGNGAVYSMPITGGTPTLLASFSSSTTGNSPYGNLILSNGILYGTTVNGGAHSSGVLFSVPVNSVDVAPTILTTFDFHSLGGTQPGSLNLANGILYGTTLTGGTFGDGEVFSVPITGGTPTVLASFDQNDLSNGDEPWGLTVSGNTLYGTTGSGGANGDGEVFSLPIGGGSIDVMASFATLSTGGAPEDSPILDASGNLYGTTTIGGIDGDGTVWTLSVPEPTSLSLLALGGASLLLRRRRRVYDVSKI